MKVIELGLAESSMVGRQAVEASLGQSQSVLRVTIHLPQHYIFKISVSHGFRVLFLTLNFHRFFSVFLVFYFVAFEKYHTVLILQTIEHVFISGRTGIQLLFLSRISQLFLHGYFLILTLPLTYLGQENKNLASL